MPENRVNREIGEKQEHASYTGLSEKWVSACNLKTGDKVLLSDGEYGIIQSIKVEELSFPETTYNLEVEDFHTYYVGEQSVCVHNKNCGNIKRGANSIEQDGVRVEVRPGEALGKTNHHSPHAHVSGKGPDTTVGLNKLPVHKSHKALSNQQKKMINNNWDEIENMIRRVWQ